MALLSIRNMSMGFGGHLLFDRVSLHMEAGERACLVGRNGEGKSTLLNIINNTIVPDEGEIYRQPGLRIGSLAQEIPSDMTGSVREITASGLEKAPDAPASTGNGAVDEEAWQLQTSVNKILTQLKLDPGLRFENLSTGLKRRVLLARALAGSPDVLLLDEPTNHMDIESIDLIEAVLSKFTGTLIFVTHDRCFLGKIATRIIEIDIAKVTSWACDYNTYLKRKAALVDAEEEYHHQFDKKLAIEEAWIRKGIRARRTRDEGRVRALLKMREERQNRRTRPGSAKMALQEAERTGKLVIKAQGISFAYDEKSVLKDFSATVMRGDRVGIIGPNGSGKTTLLGLILKNLKPDEGTVRHGVNLEVSYFDQTREQLDEERTVSDNVANGSDFVTVNGRRRHVIGYLKDFLFSPDRARSPLKTLSGGERNRLLLARLFTRPANVLVMDEPTNDLDIQTLELLEELLLEYSGTLLLVSHDRAFLNNVVTSTLVFEENGKVVEYIGGYDDWLRQKKPVPIPKTEPIKVREKKKPASGKGKSGSGNNKLGYMEKRELDALPQQIESMEKEQASLLEKMSAPDFYKTEGQVIAQIKARQEALESLLEAAYARWEDLESRNI
ncbi:MAG: ATP-binding cassette domain-containing protein [Desulfobacteraceae bacterium]|nr:ATP-binding cassette domain-containing protein [Desulfobacteraceae bacterium]MBC2754089.1 ATP-binding cassette domain-containing protein [Desulfobacteraceae bacterium]